MKRAPLLFAALALAGCAALPIADGTVRNDGMARLGEPTRVGSLVVTPRRVVEDSRCPINARCVWAGRAVVRTQIDGGGWRETRDLTLGAPIATHGTTLALTSVEPGKMAGAEAHPLAYLFGFEVGR